MDNQFNMPPGEYKIVHFEIGDYKDQNQNTWCNVLFEGHTNEPIRWVVKDPAGIAVGQTVYGHGEVKTSQAGKPYNRFYRDQKPDGQQSFTGGSKPSYAPKDDHTQESIARSVALKAAVDSFKTSADMSNVLKVADTYLAWLQNSGSQGKASVPTTATQATNETQSPASAASGLDKARQMAEQIRKRQPEITTEFGEMMPFEGGEIPIFDEPY